MSRLIYFLAGFAVCVVLASFTLVLFAQEENPLAYLQPSIVDINQSVPVTATVGLMIDDEQVTATVPLTIDVALQVRVSGIHSVTISGATKPAVNIEQLTSGETLVDDLGHSYQILTDSDEIEITEWTAFVNSRGDFEISGVIHQLPGTESVQDILTTLRVYGGEDKLLGVFDIINVWYRLEPGGYNRFGDDSHINVDSSSIDHYTLELKVIR